MSMRLALPDRLFQQPGADDRGRRGQVDKDAVPTGHQRGEFISVGVSEPAASVMHRAVDQLADEAAIEGEPARSRQDLVVALGEVDAIRASG